MTGFQRSHCQNRAACSAKSPVKHCRPCSIAQRRADPEMEARRIAGIRRRADDPAYREMMSRISLQRESDRKDDPVWQAMKRDCGLKHGAGNFWACSTGAARDLAARNIRKAHLAWCPEEYWPLNETLKRKGLRLDDRKRLISEEVERTSPAAQGRREVARHTAEMHAREARRKAQAY